ncbi:MAG: hypothetical protein IJP10_06135 [Clostridia bacterium]|nr:hypothetical protein [Oscillospiraceae bacterium]MBQ6797578.1 hypothetical protein [Clostridia bacterium]
MSDDRRQTLGLDNLIENDMTSYEYFNALPEKIQKKIRRRDISSFSDMQSYVSELKNRGGDWS